VLIVDHASDGGGGDRIELVAVSGARLPAGFAATSGARASAYEGLTLVAVDDGARPCLYVVRSDDLVADSDAVSGPVYSGCGAGSFPATVVLPLTDFMPESLRKKHPASDALRFTLHGDQVDVRAD
jgi:hypothetical protein